LTEAGITFARKAWGQALEQLAAAQQEKPLEVDDLERLATAAYLTGNNEVCDEAWTRAQRVPSERRPAAGCAMRVLVGLWTVQQRRHGQGKRLAGPSPEAD